MGDTDAWKITLKCSRCHKFLMNIEVTDYFPRGANVGLKVELRCRNRDCGAVNVHYLGVVPKSTKK